MKRLAPSVIPRVMRSLVGAAPGIVAGNISGPQAHKDNQMPRIVPSQVVGLIDQVFPQAKDKGSWPLSHKHAIVLAGMLRLIDEIPDELIRLDAKSYGEFIAAVEGIRQALETWPHQGGGLVLEKIPGLYKLNPLYMVREALSRCSDEYPPAETAGLEFITDPDLRNNLRLDVASVGRALANNEFKAATVLAGSVIEAMLLWALEQRTPAEIQRSAAAAKAAGWLTRVPKGQLVDADWSLRPYAEVAGELEIITESTRKHLRLTIDFRNLIHPGKAKRLNEACDRGTALAAAASLELLMRDLAR
jgi:hypothetical protein